MKNKESVDGSRSLSLSPTLKSGISGIRNRIAGISTLKSCAASCRGPGGRDLGVQAKILGEAGQSVN